MHKQSSTTVPKIDSLSFVEYTRSNRDRRGFTLVEIMISSAVMGFALVFMISLHSQALRSNMHAKRMTDCTYLAQAQMEQLHSLPWTQTSTPSQLVDTGIDSTLPWAYFEHPSSGAQPPARSASNGPTTNYAHGPRAYYVSWDIELMDSNSTWVRMMVRCQYLDRAFNQWHGTTISSYRFRDS